MEMMFKELEASLIVAGNPIANLLQNPLSETEILGIFQKRKLVPPPDLIALFRWKNGIEGIHYVSKILYQEKPLSLFNDFNFVELDYCVDEHLQDAVIDNYYKKKWFPIFFDGMDGVILFNLEEKKKSFGGLFLLAPDITLSEKPMRIYDSMNSWLETVITCYREGIYMVTKEGFLETDGDREKEVAIRLNPNSEYWRY